MKGVDETQNRTSFDILSHCYLLMAMKTLRRSFGFELEWRLFGTGPAIVEAFEKGELDIACMACPLL
jgi:ABC-type taurine transport system substrate-binding protein